MLIFTMRYRHARNTTRFQIIVVVFVFFKLKHFKNDKMPSLKVHLDMNVGDITQKKNMDQRVL